MQDAMPSGRPVWAPRPALGRAHPRRGGGALPRSGQPGRAGGTRLHFLSSNARKIQEVTGILGAAGIQPVPVQARIEELQTPDLPRLLRDKALKAYAHLGQPVFVDHTGLELDWLGGLPGGLTPAVWKALGAQRFLELCGRVPVPTARATTAIGFIDGVRFHAFTGVVEGTVVWPPRGDPAALWDCLFVPVGRVHTFGETGRHGELCMRARALAGLADFLAGRGLA